MSRLVTKICVSYESSNFKRRYFSKEAAARGEAYRILKQWTERNVERGGEYQMPDSKRFLKAVKMVKAHWKRNEKTKGGA